MCKFVENCFLMCRKLFFSCLNLYLKKKKKCAHTLKYYITLLDCYLRASLLNDVSYVSRAVRASRASCSKYSRASRASCPVCSTYSHASRASCPTCSCVSRVSCPTCPRTSRTSYLTCFTVNHYDTQPL